MQKRILFFSVAIMFFKLNAIAAPVPDTGVTKCYNATTEFICPSPGQPFYGQDANYTINPMSYTKLDANGNALPDSATSWTMVKDNVTGLIWEVKTNYDTKANYDDPHDADNNYTWYDSNPATNGGSAGAPGDGTDTEDFIKALNDAKYGGYNDWRLPTVKELAYIVNYSIHPSRLTISKDYFPNTYSSMYWSSTTFVDNTPFPAGEAWSVSFNDSTDNRYSKGRRWYVQAVRGGQSESIDNYTDNGDGTVTDTSTGLMWQQICPLDKMTWEQALAYCEGLDIGGYTDWRQPTIKELRSLVDYSQYNPAINTTYFTNTVASFYLSSTTNVGNTGYAWGVDFSYGEGGVKGGKSYRFFSVRAVRGGQSGSLGNLVISPSSRSVPKDAGSTTFSISITSSTAMLWMATVISGSDWLTITSGASGTNTGTIACGYTANTGTTSRTATIRVTASGASGSPADVTVTQSATATQCTGAIDNGLALHIPYLISYLGAPSFTVDMGYEYNSSYPTMIPFKLTSATLAQNEDYTCEPATLSDDLKIHIPDVLMPDGVTHIWLDLEYSKALSTSDSVYFVVTGYGAI